MRSSAWPLIVGLFFVFSCAPPDEPDFAGHFVPMLRTAMVRVYAPSGGRYLNDHTIVRDEQGTFHLFGITDESEGKPFEEQSFLHATAAGLSGPWFEAPDALVAEEALDGCCIWAPFVTPANMRWYMYYAGVSGERVLRRAESADLDTWTRSPGWADEAGRAPGGRDPFVLSSGGRRHLYSVGVDSASHGQIILTTQDERDDTSVWSEPVPVITDPEPSFDWGNLESPFVVPYEGLYYLFLTRTSEAPTSYFSTLVFASSTLDHWEWRPLTELRAHAAEVVNVDGQWFLTSGGWTGQTGEAGRGLSLAPFFWMPAAGQI